MEFCDAGRGHREQALEGAALALQLEVEERGGRIDGRLQGRRALAKLDVGQDVVAAGEREQRVRRLGRGVGIEGARVGNGVVGGAVPSGTSSA